MFKKISPDKDRLHFVAAQFSHCDPHCDQRVLHAPGECECCDRHPEWQALRIAWGIAFTGWEPEGTELPDPATAARGLESVNSWGGNVAKKSVPGGTYLDFVDIANKLKEKKG